MKKISSESSKRNYFGYNLMLGDFRWTFQYYTVEILAEDEHNQLKWKTQNHRWITYQILTEIYPEIYSEIFPYFQLWLFDMGKTIKLFINCKVELKEAHKIPTCNKEIAVL